MFRTTRQFINTRTGSVTQALLRQRPLTLDRASLLAYLRLGYVPGDRTLFENVILPLESKAALLGAESSDEEYTSDRAKTLLLKAIERRWTGRGLQVVPLSGGIDSRIILAALAEFTEHKNIHTYTYGVPGSYDFDIPNAIARYTKSQHRSFAASELHYDIDGLVRAAIATDANTEIFHPLVLNSVADHYGDSAVYWSGYAGDLVGGGFDFPEGADPKENLIAYDSRGLRFLDESVDRPIMPLITTGATMAPLVAPAEACFWENHVERYAAHHICRNDMTVETPLVDIDFVRYFYRAPPEHRREKRFYNGAFAESFPMFFEFPTKDYGYTYSGSRHRQLWHRVKFYGAAIGWRLIPRLFTHPKTAYLDMGRAINSRADVRGCVDELLSSLHRRDLPELNSASIGSMLSAHRSGRLVFAKDLINLASLEVFLRAAES